MPRVKPLGSEEMNRRTRAVISYGMQLNNLSESDMAQKLHCTRRTFQNRMMQPELFSVKDLRTMHVTFRLTEPQMLELMGRQVRWLSYEEIFNETDRQTVARKGET